MRFSVFNTFLVAFFLTALVVDSLENILIIKERTKSVDPRLPYAFRYTCISEDDRSAVVFNKNLYYLGETSHQNESEPVQPGSNPSQMCALLEQDKCIAYWKHSNDWKVVNSSDHPLGPVHDSRWEDFEETLFPIDNTTGILKKYVMNMKASGSVVFSVRGVGSIYIDFCNNRKYLKLQIKRNTDGSTIINDCLYTTSSGGKHQCTTLYTFPPAELLIDAYKWKTLILTWNKQTMSVCGEFQCSSDISVRNLSGIQSINNTDMFIYMDPQGLIRFHFYQCLLTKKKNKLFSNKFNHSHRSLCIELIVSLCDECTLEIYVINRENKLDLIGSISQNTTYRSLNIWQVVKFNKTLPKGFKGKLQLKIETVPSRYDYKNSGRWAIYNFRKCQPVGAKRISTWSSSLAYIPSPGSEPVYNCQDMSASRSITAMSSPSSESNSISESTKKYLDENSYSQVTCSSNFWARISICDLYECICVQKTDSNGVVEVSTRHPLTQLGFPELNDSNVRIVCQRNGNVAFNLNFPTNSLSSMQICTITVEYVSTWLRNSSSDIFECSELDKSFHCLLKYNQFYTLNLYPSTEYRFRIFVRYNNNQIQTYIKKFETPTILSFKKDEKLEVNVTDTFLQLKLPKILNDVKNSTVTVIVNGSSTCALENLPQKWMEHTNLTKSDKAWIAEYFPTYESRLTGIIEIQKCFVADNTWKPSSLYPGENYTILVVVLDERTNTSDLIASLPKHISSRSAIIADQKNDESISGWFISLFILAICLILLFIWRRKVLTYVKRVRQRDIVFYSQSLVNFVKSTTSLTFEQPAESLGVPSDPLSSAIVNTCEEVVSDHSATSISIKDFEKYVKESIDIGILKSQFKMFPKGILKPCAYGLLRENKPKNRYPNIIPYDDTRVVLKKILGDPCSDYINANYVPGFRKKKAYIAAQGPKLETVNDFWRMIWQEETLVICMLANVFEGQKTKCAKYWPEFGHSRTYGDIFVVTESHQVFADYIFRTFRVSCGRETRRIEHMHYTGWQDHTVPVYTHSMIGYLRKFLTMEIGPGPVVVHCSAGIGRTGTFILCDICLRRAAATGKIDVFTEFKKLRDCRLNMVDTERQYNFVHVILAECLLSLPTQLPCDNDLPQAIKVLKKQLPQHIERLNDTAWQDQALSSSSVTPRPPIPENMNKNRFPELAPVSNSLVYLKRYPTNDVNSDYINAVIVDGFKTKKQYLTSQLPLPSTLSDFWRLVAEQNVQHIVVLQRPDPQDYTCCDIIDDKSPFNPVPFINVEVRTSTDTGESSIIEELILTDRSQGLVAKTRQISVLTCTEWGLGKNGKPPPPKNLVDFWIASQNIRREEGPTLVLCHDGVTGCGLYLALSFLLERMAVERECDIILAVRAIRRSRSDFVQSREQFEYLYDAAAKYIESFETYSNFA